MRSAPELLQRRVALLQIAVQGPPGDAAQGLQSASYHRATVRKRVTVHRCVLPGVGSRLGGGAEERSYTDGRRVLATVRVQNYSNTNRNVLNVHTVLEELSLTAK